MTEDGTTALLLIDMQRDYLDRPGLVPDEQALVPRVRRLLNGFRAARAPVVHVRTLIRPDGSDAMPHWSGRLQCVDGSPGAESPPELAETHGELVARKQHYRGFADQALDPWLRSRGVARVVIAGLYTHACVRETALDAYERGYAVLIASDAVATNDPIHAERARVWLDGRVADFVPVEVILDSMPKASSPVVTAVSTGCGTTAAAQRLWATQSLHQRLPLLERWAQALQDRTEELTACLVNEVAKPVNAAEDEVRRAIGHVRSAIMLASSGAVDDETIDEGVRVQYRPVGVVGVLMPWNNPLALPCGKIAPALAFGNGVVFKPAPEGSKTADLLMDSLAAAGIPNGLVTRIDGGAAVGASIVEDSRVDAVAVTGSITTGRVIAAACARLGKPLQAELGGNNAAIVLADANLEVDVPALVHNAVAYAGQRCTAVRRFVVLADVLDDFVARAARAYAELTIGDPADHGTDVGPLISTAAASRVRAVIADAIAQGAVVVGAAPDPGGQAFVAPVLLRCDDPTARVVQEETFGPVAVIQPVENIEQAIALANGVKQGLVQFVCTRDPDAARMVLARAAAGIVQWGPGVVPVHADAPFGGWKASGNGTPEHGRWDVQFLTRPQAVYDGGR